MTSASKLVKQSGFLPLHCRADGLLLMRVKLRVQPGAFKAPPVEDEPYPGPATS
jgi:hypothetical protein